METITVDHAGPLPESGGYKYILIFVDNLSKYVILWPCISTGSVETAENLMSVFLRFTGMPDAISCDNSTSFKNSLIETWSEYVNVDMRYGLAFNPQSQGLVEKYVSILKNVLSAHCENYSTWHKKLDFIAFSFSL